MENVAADCPCGEKVEFGSDVILFCRRCGRKHSKLKVGKNAVQYAKLLERKVLGEISSQNLSFYFYSQKQEKLVSMEFSRTVPSVDGRVYVRFSQKTFFVEAEEKDVGGALCSIAFSSSDEGVLLDETDILGGEDLIDVLVRKIKREKKGFKKISRDLFEKKRGEMEILTIASLQETLSKRVERHERYISLGSVEKGYSTLESIRKRMSQLSRVSTFKLSSRKNVSYMIDVCDKGIVAEMVQPGRKENITFDISDLEEGEPFGEFAVVKAGDLLFVMKKKEKGCPKEDDETAVECDCGNRLLFERKGLFLYCYKCGKGISKLQKGRNTAGFAEAVAKRVRDRIKGSVVFRTGKWKGFRRILQAVKIEVVDVIGDLDGGIHIYFSIDRYRASCFQDGSSASLTAIKNRIVSVPVSAEDAIRTDPEELMNHAIKRIKGGLAWDKDKKSFLEAREKIESLNIQTMCERAKKRKGVENG